ncbi:MAG: SDR family oxidoreductase [Gemmatimonadetes bacterium]|nr:SDR family oxidoreductase [Gemmatimonadota bacterium]
MTDAPTSDGPRLVGRTALVTGASRGIGREIARRMADEGARVFALARSRDALDDLAAEASGVHPVQCDLTDDASTWLALDELVESEGGPPDVVVNAAGVFGIRPLAEETVNGFDAQIAVNLRAPFLVIRALLPAMLKRGSGTFVNVGSVSGYRAFPGNGAYSATKFGLRGLHEVLVEELRGTGLRATLVEPSATDTELWDPLNPDDDPHLPSRAEMLQAGDVAEAVLFAVSRPEGVSFPVLRVERG